MDYSKQSYYVDIYKNGLDLGTDVVAAMITGELAVPVGVGVAAAGAAVSKFIENTKAMVKNKERTIAIDFVSHIIDKVRIRE